MPEVTAGRERNPSTSVVATSLPFPSREIENGSTRQNKNLLIFIPLQNVHTMDPSESPRRMTLQYVRSEEAGVEAWERRTFWK